MVALMAQGVYAWDQADSSWYGAVSATAHGMTGRQSLLSGNGIALTLGYDINEPFSVEATVGYAPLRVRGTHERVAYVPVAVDGLYHFAHWDPFDPVVFLGAGYSHCNLSVFHGDRGSFSVRAGGGFFYYFKEHFAARATLAFFRSDDKGMLSVTASAGIGVFF